MDNKTIKNGNSKTKVALAMKVSRMSIWKFEQKYKKYGIEAFKT
jgi:biotin operon repressor